MRKSLLLLLFFFFIAGPTIGQEDSIAGTTGPLNILNAPLKSKDLTLDLSNTEELDFALKKIHTFRYLETLLLEGETDEGTLKKLFFRLSVLKNLTSLTLRENELSRVPETIASLKSLQVLTVEGNAGMDYSDLLISLKTVPLTELNLIDNDLKKTPAGFSGISSLKKLQLSGSNQVDYAALIDELSKLSGLSTLSIPVNYITELPKNIDQLKSLQVLDVSNNNLTELPDELSALKSINNLSIQGNLLLDPAKDLEKLKGNNIQYLSLDKEISGDELEKIKKMFPEARVDFPVSKDEKEELALKEETAKKIANAPPVNKGELRAKKETQILSGAYLLYPPLFQGLVYAFDTLGFEERYKDLRYENVYQRAGANSGRRGSFYLRKSALHLEQRGERHEKWFRLGMNSSAVASLYPELRAFGGMYWVYKGELSKKQFKRKYLGGGVDEYNFFGWKRIKRRRPVFWNDVRIEFDKNNSLFRIQLKGDTGFVEFTAYPRVAGIPLERSRQSYYRRYILYQKALLRRAQLFKRLQYRNRTRYDRAFNGLKTLAWKELQLRMSDEEKIMSEEEWLNYFDNIIANEQAALNKSSLTESYIFRALVLKGYTRAVLTATAFVTIPVNRTEENYASKTISADFVDSATGLKLPVATMLVLDNKNKAITQSTGALGLSPETISLQQFASYTLLVELRNGNWGAVSSEELDAYVFERAKTYTLKTQVFDKNLSTIGELLQAGTK